jgi:hypothetical protein
MVLAEISALVVDLVLDAELEPWPRAMVEGLGCCWLKLCMLGAVGSFPLTAANCTLRVAEAAMSSWAVRGIRAVEAESPRPPSVPLPIVVCPSDTTLQEGSGPMEVKVAVVDREACRFGVKPDTAV